MSELLASAGQAGMRPSLRRRLFGRIPAAFAETGGSLYSLPEREQLERYADAFYGLARLFQKMPCQKERLGDEDLEQLFAQVRGSVCTGCGREARCWGNDYFQSCRIIRHSRLTVPCRPHLDRTAV